MLIILENLTWKLFNCCFEWSCSVDNLTGLLFSRGKVIATQLIITIVRGSYTIFREENWFCPYGKHCECTVFILNVTQYSPVLQRFSAKTNELIIARFDCQLLVAQRKLSDRCSCSVISFQDLICEWRPKFSGKFPFVKNKYQWWLRTRTVDWHYSVCTDHKILHNEAQNEDE